MARRRGVLFFPFFFFAIPLQQTFSLNGAESPLRAGDLSLFNFPPPFCLLFDRYIFPFPHDVLNTGQTQMLLLVF